MGITPRRGSAAGLGVLLVVALHAQAAAERYDTAVVGGGPAGVMAALAVAQSAKRAGRSSYRVAVLEKRSEQRTRNRWIVIDSPAIRNAVELGYDFGMDPPLRQAVSSLSPTETFDPHGWQADPNKDMALSSNIIAFESAGYDAVRRWNMRNPDFAIDLRFETGVTALEVADGKEHTLQIEGGRRSKLRAKHLVVADGGRAVSKMLQDANYIDFFDRGVEDFTTRTGKKPIRLRFVNQAALGTDNDTTVTIVGDAVATTHWGTGSGVVRATTDAIALRGMFEVLLRPNATRRERIQARRSYNRSRIRSVETMHDFAGDLFKNQSMTIPVNRTMTEAARKKLELHRSRRKQTSKRKGLRPLRLRLRPGKGR